MNPDCVKNAAIELTHQFVPHIPKKSLLRPLSGRIYSTILSKTEDQNLSLFKKIALKVNFIWCILLIPMDMTWNIILIPITFICLPVKHTFGIGHNLPGAKKWLEEIKVVFVCIIEIGILPISFLVPSRWMASAHHKLMGYGFTINSPPPGFNKDAKSLTSSLSVSENNSGNTTPTFSSSIITPLNLFSSSSSIENASEEIERSTKNTLELISETLSRATEFQHTVSPTPPKSPPLSSLTANSPSLAENETDTSDESLEVLETHFILTEFYPTASPTPSSSPLISPLSSSSSSSSITSETDEHEDTTEMAPLRVELNVSITSNSSSLTENEERKESIMSATSASELITELLQPTIEFQPTPEITPPSGPPPSLRASSSSATESETEELQEVVETTPIRPELIPETHSPATEFQPTTTSTTPSSPPLSPRTSSRNTSSIESKSDELEESVKHVPTIPEPLPTVSVTTTSEDEEDLDIFQDLDKLNSKENTTSYPTQNPTFSTTARVPIPEKIPTGNVDKFLATRAEKSPEKIHSKEPKCRPLISPAESFSDSQLFASDHLNNSTVVESYLMPKTPSPLNSLDQSPASSVTSLSSSVIVAHEPTWVSNNNGTGPTIVGQALNVGTTAKNLLWGAVTNYWTPPRNSLEATLNNPGTQLDGNILQCYFAGLIESVGSNKMFLIADFYASDAFGIANLTPDSLEEQLSCHTKEITSRQAIVIPLILPGPSRLERNHIVTVLIKDGRMEYYDSKGILSEKTVLPSGYSLNQMLQVIKKAFLPESQAIKIRENRKTHQTDANNCGAFVSKFIYDRLQLKRSFRDICSSDIPDIAEFRKEMLSFVERGHDIASSYSDLP